MPAPRNQRATTQETGVTYFERHREQCLESQRKYRAKMKAMRLTDPLDRIKRLWGTIGSGKRANSGGRAFTIKFEDLDWPTHCPVLGVKIDYTSKLWSEGWSLDRLDSNLDYIPGNVRVISARANVIKSFGTAEEHDQIAAWMESKCQ